MKKYFRLKRKEQRAFTLLEYCAGAAVIIAIVVAGMQVLGGGLNQYFDGLAAWVGRQGDRINTVNDTTNIPNP